MSLWRRVRSRMVGLLCGIPIHADVRHDRAPFQHWLHFAKRNVPGDRANVIASIWWRWWCWLTLRIEAWPGPSSCRQSWQRQTCRSLRCRRSWTICEGKLKWGLAISDQDDDEYTVLLLLIMIMQGRKISKQTSCPIGLWRTPLQSFPAACSTLCREISLLWDIILLLDINLLWDIN